MPPKYLMREDEERGKSEQGKDAVLVFLLQRDANDAECRMYSVLCQ